MKLKKIFMPEIEIEFIGVKGFFAALLAVCKVGIKKASINYTIKDFPQWKCRNIKTHYFYVIPKYKFKRVSKIEESEVDTE